MSDDRGVKVGLAEPVKVLSDEEVKLRGVKVGLATPVYVINPEEIGGDPGSGDDVHFVHNQITPSAAWTITHNLGKHPSVSIVDSAGTMVVGDVTYHDLNSLTITFGSAFSGKAYLN